MLAPAKLRRGDLDQVDHAGLRSPNRPGRRRRREARRREAVQMIDPPPRAFMPAPHA
jgi:hypothetical protein